MARCAGRRPNSTRLTPPVLLHDEATDGRPRGRAPGHTDAIANRGRLGTAEIPDGRSDDLPSSVDTGKRRRTGEQGRRSGAGAPVPGNRWGHQGRRTPTGGGRRGAGGVPPRAATTGRLQAEARTRQSVQQAFWGALRVSRLGRSVVGDQAFEDKPAGRPVGQWLGNGAGCSTWNPRDPAPTVSRETGLRPRHSSLEGEVPGSIRP